MKKLASVSLVFVLVGVWAVGCTTVVVKEDRGPEILFPGEMIESVDANTVRVKCQGVGPTLEVAVLQARKGCVEWMVENQLAQTPGEKQAYKAAQQQVFAQLDKYIGLPGPGAASGHDKGIKSRTRISEDKIRVELIEDVAKQALMDDLVAMGVIKSHTEMLDAVGRPTLMVFPGKASKGNKDRKNMEGLVASYLTKAKWEVLNSDAVENLNKMVDAIGEVAGAEEDEVAKIALAVGANIYVKFEATKEKKGNGQSFKVNIEAYETTTGRQLAAEFALSSPRATWVAGEEAAAFAEALNDAMGKVMPQITAYWKEDAPKGNRFTIVIKNAPKNSDIKLATILKKACSSVKADSFPKQVNFTVQCKADNLELAGVLSEGIDEKLAGADYDFAAKNKNNLIIVFK